MVFTFYLIPWRTMRKLPLSIYHEKAYLSSMSKAPVKYDAYLSVFIERHNVISRPLNELEKNFCKLLQDIEFENSHRSNFELRKEEDSTNSQKPQEEIDLSLTSNFKCAQDVEEWSDKELESLTISSKLTEAKSKDPTSLDKNLDGSLFFVTQQNIGTLKNVWLPPQSMVQKNETLKEAAKRIVKDNCGENFKVSLYGNAPIGVEKRSFVESIDGLKRIHKQKIFYFLAKYVNGSVENNTKYHWLNMQELKKVLPEKVYKISSQCLITSN